MNLATQTDTLMKPFLNSFGKCDQSPPLSKADQGLYQTLLISLYNDIYEANSTIFQNACFQSKVINLKTDPTLKQEPEDKNTRYFPAPIQKYIQEEEQYQLIFTCQNVAQREITVIFTLFDEAELKRKEMYTHYVKMIYIWLHICGKYAAKECTETLHVFIYPTPFMKNLPTNPATIIGPEHINTAFTMACVKKGHIIIFREEEWFKVFIHETFHSYGLDFATQMPAELKKGLKALFPINSDFDIYEAYTETWARIINCVFCSFNSQKKRDQKGFLLNMNFCLEMERMFALYQCSKILGFMGLHYNDIKKPHHLYKENTHVFAYYIMTTIFLNDYRGFMLWCKKHNTRLLKFQATPVNFQEFLAYITEKHVCISLLKNLNLMGDLNAKVNKTQNKFLKTTTRMSLIQYN